VTERYLELLGRRQSLRSPLGDVPLREWRARLGAPLPARSRIYAVTDGSTGSEDLPMRLMHHSEVLDVTDSFSNDLARAGVDLPATMGLHAANGPSPHGDHPGARFLA
jgi:hypothetical protein